MLNLKRIKPLVIPLMICLILVTVVSGASPIYKTNQWNDTNAMLTMGRSLLQGTIPMKDIVDQRGPIMYFIYAFAALIKSNSFLGLYIIELINVFIIYALSFKLVKAVNVETMSPYWVSLVGPVALLTTSAFSQGGSPEEFGFASVLYLLVVLGTARENVTHIRPGTYYLLGLNMSLLFWSKYTLAGSYVFFFLTVGILLLWKLDFKQLFKVIIFSLLGFLTITALVLSFYIAVHGLNGLIDYYFVQNLTGYTTPVYNGLVQQNNIISKSMFIAIQIARMLWSHWIILLIILTSWFISIKNSRPIIIEMVTFIGSLVFITIGAAIMHYYALIIMSYFAVALIFLIKYLPYVVDKNTTQQSMFTFKFLTAFCILLMPFINNSNILNYVVRGTTTSINGENQWKTQRKFAKRMHKGYDKPTLLQVNSLDGGFYLAADIIPTTKYFHRLNMNYDQFPKMYDDLQESLATKKTDFVVVRVKNNNLDESDSNAMLKRKALRQVDEHLRPDLSQNYKVVDKEQDTFNKPMYYVLFEKVD